MAYCILHEKVEPSKNLRILFCGSRDWQDADIIGRQLLRFDPATTTIVHGACRGDDLLSARMAKELGFTNIEAYQADWNKHGKRAGYLRNKEMIDSGVSEVVAFCLDNSKGTAITIELARNKGIPVTVIHNGKE